MESLTINYSFIDNIIILFYFAIVLTIGLYVSKQRDKNVKQYFLADKSLGWIAIGASLFATNISSEHFIGLAGAGSVYGLGIGQFELMAAIFLLMLGWIFAPIIIRANVNTMPQFFGKRFDHRSRIYLTIISIFTYLFIKIGIILIAGGIVLKGVLGWDMFTSAILIVLLTGIYTVIGGMYAVVYTQIFQTMLIILGAFLLSFWGYIELGGLSGLFSQLPGDYFQVLKSFEDPNLPLTGILFGAPIIGIWYWCSDQYIVQRIISAKGIREAKKGTVLAAILKIIPTLFLIFPGLVATALYSNTNADMAYASLLGGDFLPDGIRGLVIIGFIAALMSSLSRAFNSAGSLAALDIYGMIKPKASESESVLVGRLSTMIFVIAAIAIIPLLKFLSSNIFYQLQAIQAYIAPPIVSVFLVGISWKNASSLGAIWALIIGGFLGLVKIIFTFISTESIKSILILDYYNSINPLIFAAILFAVSTIIIIAFSINFSNKKIIEHETKKIAIDENEVSLNHTIQQIDQSKTELKKTIRDIIHK